MRWSKAIKVLFPSSSLSSEANQVMTDYFPDRVSPSSVVLVVDVGPGEKVDEGKAADFITQMDG